MKSDVRKPVMYGALVAILLAYRLGAWIYSAAQKMITWASASPYGPSKISSWII